MPRIVFAAPVRFCSELYYPLSEALLVFCRKCELYEGLLETDTGPTKHTEKLSVWRSDPLQQVGCPRSRARLSAGIRTRSPARGPAESPACLYLVNRGRGCAGSRGFARARGVLLDTDGALACGAMPLPHRVHDVHGKGSLYLLTTVMAKTHTACKNSI